MTLDALAKEIATQAKAEAELILPMLSNKLKKLKMKLNLRL